MNEVRANSIQWQSFDTVIMGKFHNSRLKSGYAYKIIGYRCYNGIMELRFSSRSSPEVYFYDPISEAMPTLMQQEEIYKNFIDYNDTHHM